MLAIWTNSKESNCKSIAAYAAYRTPNLPTRTGASWGVASSGVNVPLTKTQSARDSSPPTPNTTRQTPDATTD